MEYKDIIKKGSKSFSMASMFFSETEKSSSWKLYSWCRHCDDLIDEIQDESPVSERLKYLRAETADLINKRPTDFHMLGLYEVIRNYSVPLQYPMDLLRGMEMDVEGRRFQTLKELEFYCYCVAGTVGLMMCHILGVRNDEALKHAVSLGNAMQLTNICRDISEDHQKGRLYIPLNFIQEMGLNEVSLFEEKSQHSLIYIQERLLKRADELYEDGMKGLSYLSIRSAWAVLIAAMVYSEIGRVIRENPSESLKKRAVVSKGRKVWIVFKSIFKLIPFLFHHLKSEKVSPPQSVWSMNS